MNNRSYKDLVVWQKSITLVKEVYVITEKLPKSQAYTLIPQLQRAAISIPSNIAEGYKRNYRKEFIQFLSIANGSAGELETQLIIAKELFQYIDYSVSESLLLEVQKMLSKLLTNLKKSIP